MKKLFLISIGCLVFSSLIIFFVIPNFAQAANCPACNPNIPGYCMVGGKCQLQNPAPDQLVGFSDVGSLIARFIEILLYFAGAVATVFLIIGGYRYVASQGNEEAMEKAKKTITSAVIGIVIIVMSFAIVMLVNNFLTKTPAQNAPVTLSDFVLS